MTRKSLALGLTSLAVLAATASDAFGFLFLLKHCARRYGSVIVCRPYNAFTPICYGNMVCDGCCPPASCGPVCGPVGMPSPCFQSYGCIEPGGHLASAAPTHLIPAPMPSAPAPSNPNFTPPPPAQIPNMTQGGTWPPMPVAYTQPYPYGYGYPYAQPQYPANGGVQPVNYAPYYPMPAYPYYGYGYGYGYAPAYGYGR